MVGVDPQGQPVEKAPAVARRAGEKPVHSRRQPQRLDMLGEGALGCRRRAIDAKASRRIALAIGLQSMAELQDLVVCLQFDGNREASRPVMPRAKADLRAAQPAPRRKHRERFENIGLSSAVFAGERDGPGAEPRVERRVGAKVAQRQPADQRT